LFKGHNWSRWYEYAAKDKQYRYCIRCSEIEYKIGLKVVKAKPKGKMSILRDTLNWFINLGKPSFKDSLEIATREASEQWYSKVPRNELNEAIKCLANELSNIEDINSPRLWLCKECIWCRYQLFCNDIIHSMTKAFKKYSV